MELELTLRVDNELGPWTTHGCGLLSAGCVAAVSREVAAGDSGDHLRDRHAGQVRAGYQRSSGEPRPAGAAGEGLLGAGVGMHHVCRLQEDRAGDGYRGGSGRGVGDGGEGV